MFKKFLFTLPLFFSLPSWAQYQMNAQLSGTGYWGGTQGCAYQQKAAPGATSTNDAVSEIQAQIAEYKKQLASKKKEKKRLDRDGERNRTDIQNSLADDYSGFLIEHIEGARRCDEYKGVTQSSEPSAQGDQGGRSVSANHSMISVTGFSVSEWRAYCDSNKAGGVFSSVCDNSNFKQNEGRSNSATCKKALTDYRTNYAKSMKLQNEIEGLESSIERAKDDLADAKEDAAQARQDGLASDSSNTEGGVCVECAATGNGYTYQKPQTDWANVISNVGTGLAAMYMGYQSNKMVTQSNADLGWPTQSYPTWSYGLPYLANGLYGALGGGTGQGGFGCGGSSSGNMIGGMMGGMGSGMMGGMNGGAFGYPSSMMGMNTMGGGIYNGGMGPWGMNAGYGGIMGGMTGAYASSMGYGGMTGSYMGIGGMMNSYVGGMTGSYMGSYSGAYSSGYDQYSLQMAQMQMQYQQQYAQQQYSKYSTMMSLQTEISNLMYKMQAVQLGYGTSSNYVSGTTGTTYTSSGILPAPGTSYSSYNYSSTVPGSVPAPTSTSTAVSTSGR